MNRCSQMDISFPYLLPGWSVDVQNGQYRDSLICGDGRDCQLGKEGWFGREGQPPGPSMIMTLIRGGGGGRALGGRPPAWRQPKGGTHGARWDPECPGLSSLGEPHS